MFDAYKVAVKIKLVNEVSSGLVGLASQFKGLDNHVLKAQASVLDLEKSLAKLKRTGLIGGAMAAAGGFGLALFKGPLEEANKFDQQVQKFKLFGMGDKVNAEAVKFAKGMNIMGSSYTENMKLFIEAQGVFRESGIGGSEALDGAKLAAPLLAKIAFSTSSLDGESAAKLRASSMAMLRYVEDSGGLKSPARFQELANAGWKMVQTSGGSVNWEQLRQFKARSGVAGMNMSGDAMAEMEPIITMLKGQTAGFSLRTAYNRLNGIIKIPNQVAHELIGSGLWDAHKVIFNSMGGIKSFKGNPLNHADEFSDNPISFYEKYIMPIHAKLGIKTDSQIAQSNSMLFGSTGGNMFTLIDKNLAKLHQFLDAQNKALGIDASYDISGNTGNGAMIDLHAKWKNVLAELGTSILPLAISAAQGLTSVLKGVSNFAREWPELTKWLTVGFGVLAGIVATGGVLMLATSAIKAFGLVLAFPGIGGIGGAAGIRAIAAAIAGGGGLTLVAGLAALGAVVFGMAKTLEEVGGDGIHDPLNHPGMRFERHGRGANNGVWKKDPTVSQEHAGQHFVRYGRSGTWENDVQPLNVVPSGKAKTVQVTTQINLDSKPLARAVTEHQVKELARPTGGTTGFDSSMHLLPPGANGGM